MVKNDPLFFSTNATPILVPLDFSPLPPPLSLSLSLSSVPKVSSTSSHLDVLVPLANEKLTLGRGPLFSLPSLSRFSQSHFLFCSGVPNRGARLVLTELSVHAKGTDETLTPHFNFFPSRWHFRRSANISIAMPFSRLGSGTLDQGFLIKQNTLV